MDAVLLQRDAIYQFVQGVLDNTSRIENSSISLSDAIGTFRSAFDEACADYAQDWNQQNSRASLAGHLAPEILANCFRFASFESLIRATHVCRRWRDIALADRTVWASFRFGSDWDGAHSFGAHSFGRAVAQLAVMLDRSRPAPFLLQLPLAASEDKERLYSALQNDLGRLRSYAGPRDVYLYLTKQDLPMPYLTEIVFLKETDHDQWLRFDFPPNMGSHGAPQLRRLVAPMISIPATCAALHSLKELKFSVYGPSSAYRRLFLCCPNLTMLELVGVQGDTVLPVPLPPSLCDISLRAPDGACVEFGLPLAAWSGRLIRRLSLYGEKSLAAALDAFASSFPGPLDIVMTRNQATISLNSASAHDAQTQHVIYPFSWQQDNQLLALRGPCGGRLVSITVPGERFGDFFKTQLILPRLARLEFHLDGYFDACGSIPDLPSPEFHLSAPILRDMLVRVPFDAQAFYSDADRWCEAAVAALCQHLRALIAYDAALLETMAIRGSPGVIDLLKCSGLLQYAKCSI